MKLTIEFIPFKSQKKNLRNKLTPYYWQLISTELQCKSQHTCEICKRVKGGIITKLHCHEVWEYNYNFYIQRLVGLQILCFECHTAKHMGFAYIHETIDEKSIKKHFMKINEITEKEYEKYLEIQYESYDLASSIDWIIDYGEWRYLVEDEQGSKELKENQINKILNYLRENEKITDEELYKEIDKSGQLLKTAFNIYLNEARKLIKEEFTEININKIYKYLEKNKRATNSNIYKCLYYDSNVNKYSFDKYAKEARKKLRKEHIKRIFTT